jgi:pimeloyl-ACP methyl ester carboxylesterase
MKDHQITLQTRRIIGFAEFGSPEGFPIFYFHGFPSSRLDWQLVNREHLLKELNIRIIAPDRPGYGLSQFQLERKIVDWPDDVIAIADHLNFDRFAAIGISGGGPYAAACAHSIHDRLTNIGIVSGMGPSSAPGMQDGSSWTIPGTFSPLRGIILRLTAMGIEKDPDKFISRSRETFSEPDQKLLDQPEIAGYFLDGMREAFHQGTKGANHEAALFTRPWGFNLKDIANNVHLWHGEQDLNVPISVGRYMAEHIPGCNSKFFNAEGHLSLAHTHLHEILSSLIE